MNPAYSHDKKLRSTQVLRCAVLYNRASALKCIEEVRVSDRDDNWYCKPGLVRLAVQRTDSDLKVLEWVYTRFSQKKDHRHPCPFEARYLLFHTQRGNLEVVRWLCERIPSSISQGIVDEAAIRRYPHVLRYLYDHSTRRCKQSALEVATLKGYLDVVKLIIIANQEKVMRRYAINAAARCGHVEIIRFIVESASAVDLPPPGLLTARRLQAAGSLKSSSACIDTIRRVGRIARCRMQHPLATRRS